MNLYLLTTEGLGDFYVVAEHPSAAQKILSELLNHADYGFTDKRRVKIIKHLATELGEFPAGKTNFSSGNNLIISPKQ